MALPLSRNVTYVSGTTPYIAAGTENDVQDYIVHAFQGTRTLKKMQIDGVSDNATTVADGALMVSRTVVSATYPSTAVAAGEYNKDGAPAALAQLSGGFFPPGTPGGGLLKGYGIKDLNRVAAGEYEVTFLKQPTGADADNACVQVTSGAAGAGYPTATLSIVAGDLVATITLSAGADFPFFVTAWIW